MHWREGEVFQNVHMDTFVLWFALYARQKPTCFLSDTMSDFNCSVSFCDKLKVGVHAAKSASECDQILVVLMFGRMSWHDV